MDANPYSAPSETASVADVAPNPSRIAGAVIAAFVGVPTSGVLAYLLFSWCTAVGSAVIADNTWDTYSPRMFVFGALCGILPCVSCGFLNPERPILVGIISHSLGLLIAAILATAHFRWPAVMGCYAGFALVLPVLIAAARRPT